MSRIQKLENIYKEQLKEKDIKDTSNFIQYILDADVTKGKYARFLIEAFLNDKFLEEDLIGGLESTVGQAIRLFDKHKGKLPVHERSVYTLNPETKLPLYQSPGDLWNSVKQYQGELSGKELKREEQEKIYRETEFVYKDEETGFQIVSPLTEESAKWWGKGTRWCTSAEKNNLFYNYAKDAPLFILLLSSGQKLQFWKNENNIQFMDEADNNVTIQKIVQNISDIYSFLEMQECNKSIYSLLKMFILGKPITNKVLSNILFNTDHQDDGYDMLEHVDEYLEKPLKALLDYDIFAQDKNSLLTNNIIRSYEKKNIDTNTIIDLINIVNKEYFEKVLKSYNENGLNDAINYIKKNSTNIEKLKEYNFKDFIDMLTIYEINTNPDHRQNMTTNILDFDIKRYSRNVASFYLKTKLMTSYDDVLTNFKKINQKFISLNINDYLLINTKNKKKEIHDFILEIATVNPIVLEYLDTNMIDADLINNLFLKNPNSIKYIAEKHITDDMKYKSIIYNPRNALLFKEKKYYQLALHQGDNNVFSLIPKKHLDIELCYDAIKQNIQKNISLIPKEYMDLKMIKYALNIDPISTIDYLLQKDLLNAEVVSELLKNSYFYQKHTIYRHQELYDIIKSFSNEKKEYYAKINLNFCLFLDKSDFPIVSKVFHNTSNNEKLDFFHKTCLLENEDYKHYFWNTHCIEIQKERLQNLTFKKSPPEIIKLQKAMLPFLKYDKENKDSIDMDNEDLMDIDDEYFIPF